MHSILYNRSNNKLHNRLICKIVEVKLFIKLNIHILPSE